MTHHPHRVLGRRGLLVLALAAATAGLVLVGIALTGQESAPDPHPAGSLRAADGGGHSSPAGASRSHRSAGPATPDGADKAALPPLGPSRPVRIRIPAIGVDSAVNPIGRNPDGSLAVPQPGPHLDEAAWYEASPTPGQPGPSIIEGHVDSAQGPSVFFKLGDIRPGDRIRITRQDGIRLVFRVNAVRDFKKAEFPTSLVYGTDLTEPSLRLITCSDFVESIHHHIGNEVVFAHLTRRSDQPHADHHGQH